MNSGADKATKNPSVYSMKDAFGGHILRNLQNGTAFVVTQ